MEQELLGATCEVPGIGVAPAEPTSACSHVGSRLAPPPTPHSEKPTSRNLAIRLSLPGRHSEGSFYPGNMLLLGAVFFFLLSEGSSTVLVRFSEEDCLRPRRSFRRCRRWLHSLFF